MRDISDEEIVPGALGAGVSATAGHVTYVLQGETDPAAFAGTVLHTVRSGSSRLVLFADAGASVGARLAQWFDLDIELRSVQGATSVPAQAEPMPVVLPGPDDADELLDLLRSHDLEVVAEQGSWRGELLGLEVARIVEWPRETGGDGQLHLEAGVGRFDRERGRGDASGRTPGGWARTCHWGRAGASS